MAEFECNICGTKNAWSGQPFERETPGCAQCGSSLRTRALIGALSMELFGVSLSLRDFPRAKSLRGLGASDSAQYAGRLGEAFDYRNTFFDRPPRLDLGDVPEQESCQYDFIVSSDVFEHVAPPAERAFRNAYRMLKPNGVLLFTVPYEIEDAAEHFPELHEYGLAEVGERLVMVNRTRAGELQLFENLSFHRSDEGKALEMRVFSEESLRGALAAAGFESVKIHAANDRQFGIVSAEAWSLPVAARKGAGAGNPELLREVVEQWRDLRAAFRDAQARSAQPRWRRIGRRLKLL